MCHDLIETFDFLINALFEGHNFDVILLDLFKAFDLVPHRRLIHKIHGYGASNEITSWLEDFLKDRRQRVFRDAQKNICKQRN